MNMTRKAIITTGYFLFLLYVVLLNPMRFKHKITKLNQLRIHPFTDFLHDLTYAGSTNAPIQWINFLGNIFGNIILFIPFTFITIWVFRMSGFFKIAGLACLLSISIEVAQYFTGLGVADIDDVILNTAGAAIGFLLIKKPPKH
jgi:glycopeptide antibiotics resistance protein